MSYFKNIIIAEEENKLSHYRKTVQERLLCDDEFTEFENSWWSIDLEDHENEEKDEQEKF